MGVSARCAVGCGLRPVPTSPSRPFGFNPHAFAPMAARSRLRGRQRPAAKGGTCAGLRPGLLRQVVQKRAVSTLAVRRLYVMKDGSPTHRPALQWSFHTTPHAKGRKQREGAFTLSLGIVLARVRAQAGEAVTRGCRVGHVSIRERAASTSLCCFESRRWLGFMAATFQRKQFPLRCAHSSRDKFFSLPGSPRCCDRCAVRPAHPHRTDHNKDALARPCSTRKGNHHG